MKKITILIVAFILLFSAFSVVAQAQEGVSNTNSETSPTLAEDEFGGDDIESSERLNDGSLPDYEEAELYPIPTLENSIEQKIEGADTESAEEYPLLASVAISAGVFVLILLFFIIKKRFDDDLPESSN